MLKKFSVIMFVVFLAQVYLNGIESLVGAISFITLLFFLLVQIKLLSKVRLEYPGKEVFIISKCIYVFGFLCSWSLYYFFSNYQNQVVTSLTTLSDVEKIGIYYKTSNVIIPALAYVLVKTIFKDKNKLKLVIIGIAFACCLTSSIFTLSKAPLINFIFLILGTFKIRWYQFIIGLPLTIFLLYIIYNTRGQSDSIQETLKLIVNRLPLFIELKETYSFLSKNLFIDYNQLSKFSSYVTEDIFKRDSRYVGIAPGTISSFILIFNFFSPFVFVMVLESVKNLLNNLSKKNQIGFITASMLTFEIIHSLIDGLPHFYTSTNNGMFFWGLVGLTLITLLIRKNEKK